ncbi:MAG: YhgE/Pip domain-containing protein [Bacillota bacterium]|nr:YhgE/Pip domain-containing protein [Bacillota bacterium]
MKKRNTMIICVIIGVILIPLMYSYFYLGAFWDPYSRLQTLPVAVVNNDTGAEINGKARNLGNEMCDRLKDDASLKFVFTDEDSAKKGTEGKDYYAMIVIPKDFSDSIASADSANKHPATITYSANEKRNFLASQILNRAVVQMEETTRSNINKELTDTLIDKIREVPDKMADLQDGMNKLSDGANDLSDGAGTLKNGTAEFASSFNKYKSGVSTVKDGSAKLESGAQTLDEGISKLKSGADALAAGTANIDALSNGAKTLAAGAKTFNDSLSQYTAGVDSLISTVSATSDFLKNYATTLNPDIMKDPYFSAFMTQLSDPKNAQSIETLKNASSQLKAASSQISAGADSLANGAGSLPQLKAALANLSQGLSQAKAGASALDSGSKSLYSGISELNSATGKLGSAASDIHSGAQSLYNGTNDLKDGINEAKDGVNTSVSDANDQIKNLDGLGDFAKEPVSIKSESINPVPNYGTAFAPYFMSLSLWVGAIIIFFGIFLDADNRFKILSRNSENKLARSFIYLLLGFTQAIVLGTVAKVCLGLAVKNNILFYLSCCLISMVFISIVQLLLVYLKDLGKFLSLALLILQLTSCAGTFPMETVPKFFNVLYPYMPMTYSVGLLKEVISGIDKGNAWFNAGILVAILLVFMALTIILSLAKSKSEARKSQQETVIA